VNNCWNCSYNRLGGITLLGICWWFVKGHGYAKEIPREVCDKGCKYWTDEPIDFKALEKLMKPIVKEEELW